MKPLYRGIKVGRVSIKGRLGRKPGLIVHFFGYALHVNAHKIQKGIML